MNAYEKYIGRTFGDRYRIDRLIGIGGMAAVYEAYDLKEDRVVAIKLLKDEITNDVQSVKRFINESKAVSMMNHPNIVRIYDVAVSDELKYIVMDRVEGITLKKYMNVKKALSFNVTMSVAEQVLSALVHAHKQGVIHRDIKPSNFGFETLDRFFSEKLFNIVCGCALGFYCLSKAYSFFCGANGLESGIGNGRPGAILSAGLILPLNLAVGMVVAMTMLGIYCMFRRGRIGK